MLRYDASIKMSSSRETPSQVQRLVDWNAEILLRLLKQVVAKRNAAGKSTWEDENSEPQLLPNCVAHDGSVSIVVLDEVTDIIDLPGFEQSSSIHTSPNGGNYIELSPAAVGQLKNFVKAVANAYHSNPFHCLQHASQVSMAVTKLLSRIIVKDLEEEEDSSEDDDEGDDVENVITDVKVTDALASHLHSHTYGITSDPLTQFTIVLSAFVHAVDHRGVPNEQIVKEEPDVAAMYKYRSITEQRSVDKTWKKLMSPEFTELRKCIYSNVSEKRRFRQVLVNAVLATDIDDVELQSLRMNRWEATFQERRSGETSANELNRKATIVIEHLIQSADIFHFMQPWIIYEKWSSRQFEEMYVAFRAGRSNTDPSTTWYKSELQFFDNYVVPLAMQLKDCDAFVVGSDEFLNYALENRRQFASQGKELVLKMLKKLEGKPGNAGGLLSPIPVSTGNKVSRSNLPTIDGDETNSRIQRLVEWNVEMLQRLLKQIVAKRAALGQSDRNEDAIVTRDEGETPLDEMVSAISFADFEAAAAPDQLNPNSVELSLAAITQLRDYVTDISRQFRQNPFHCLERESQVCMTARTSITRLINGSGNCQGEDLHNKTFGISSDPLAQFALVFAALINNADHKGVPNSQLVHGEDKLAIKYKGKSVLEQNSIDIAFNHLMRSEFEDLRACIYANNAELKRFRQVVVNSVLATDCTNDEIISLRKARFEKAFGGDNKLDLSKDSLDLKGTVALEMLMASSDMFHATQSWQVYQKWSERHFQELYTAFQIGRLRQDPSIVWNKLELTFFDEHVIPLAKLMSEGGLFGVSGDDILGSALSNRQQWAAKGSDLVASMMARYHGKEVEKVRARRRHRRMSLTPQQA